MALGILALQGAFDQHKEALLALECESPVLVRYPEELENLDGLIMPGGESTTISKLLKKSGLDAALKDCLNKGLPIFATCAGLILLAREINGGTENLHQFGALDVSIARNAYGPQIESFEAPLDIPILDSELFCGVFIRSPIIEEVGKDVEILASHNEHPVFCLQKNILATSFHPELTDDLRIHKFFLDTMIR